MTRPGVLTADEDLLCAPSLPPLSDADTARIARISREIASGFSALGAIGPAVSVVGSARVREGSAPYQRGREVGGDERVRVLLGRQADGEADGLAAGALGGAAVGRLHDARAAARADHEAPGMIAERHGPRGDPPSQFAGLFVVARHFEGGFRVAQ